MTPSQPATKDDLRLAVREIVDHFNAGQTGQNHRLDGIDTRLESVDTRLGRVETRLDSVAEDVSKIKLAIVDLMSTDRHLHNLVEVLKRQGITLNDTEIFRA